MKKSVLGFKMFIKFEITQHMSQKKGYSSSTDIQATYIAPDDFSHVGIL